MITLKTVLVATDFSEPSEVAVRYGRALADAFHATLHVMHVVPDSMSLPWATMADGLACRNPDEAAVEIINKGAARIVTVSEDEIARAMRVYYADTHNLAEGAGAAPLAALMQEQNAMRGKKVGVILSGGNIDRDLYLSILSAADEAK